MAPWLRCAGAASLAIACLTAPRIARADRVTAGESAPPPATPEKQAEAQRHFKTAQESYQRGNYQEAISELKSAVSLDPGAKDLYFNLGVVYEKVDDIDSALDSFHRYQQFDLDSNERARAEKYVRRLEGAKARRPAPTTAAPAPVAQTEPAPTPKMGRVDGFTIAGASVAGAALTGGIVTGILALTTQPKNFVTGQDGTYDDLAQKQSNAHTLAVVSDVCFAVAAVSAAVTAYLYFGRAEDDDASKRPLVVAGPVPGGAAAFVGGRF